jgi:hypothetical protein
MVDKVNPLKGYDPARPKFVIADELDAKLSPETICYRIRQIYLRALGKDDPALMALAAECWDMAKRMNHRLIYYRDRFGDQSAPDDFPYKW